MGERMSDQTATLVDVLRQYALECPGRPAVTFLNDGEDQESTLTYSELDARARGIAAVLQERGLSGQPVLLAYPSGLEFVCAFWGCLYAGAIAVPVCPTRPRGRESVQARIRAIAEDTRARLTLLTSGTLKAMESGAMAGQPTFGSACLPTDAIGEAASSGWRSPPIDSKAIAFLQYTSGSTSTPKGVVVSHGNILANVRMIAEGMEFPPGFTVAGWLPLFHDMGLIGNLLTPNCRGGHAVLMSPMDFLQRPVRWLRAISKYRAYVSGGPNFAYALCARKVSEQQKATLDLSAWQVAFCGAERVSPQALDAFATAFASCGFQRRALFPCYGLAEATLMVAGGPAKQGATVRHLVQADLEQGRFTPALQGDAASAIAGCGRPLQEVRIVDPETRAVLEPGRVGEVWIRGSNVAGGYWNRPDLTHDVFGATLSDGADGTFLRTGDLGFLDQESEHGEQLYLVGRIKDLVIVDGRNLYPEDIEATIERAHPAVRQGCCVAFSTLVDDAERLVVVAELDAKVLRRADPESRDRERVIAEVNKIIRAAISEEHDARAHAVLLVEAGAVPKTSSGKLQRSACRAAFNAKTLRAIES